MKKDNYFDVILKFSILGLGPPLTSNTTEFVAEQVQLRRQHHTPLARSSIADVFGLGGGETADANLDAAANLKPGARKHLVGEREAA